MEIKQLRQFRVVVESGGITSAAALLNLTPGAVSKAIRRLEEESGKTLFLRVGRSLKLTRDGRRLYFESETLLEAHQKLLSRMNASTPSAAPTLRLASFEVFTTHVLTAVLDTMDADFGLRVVERSVTRIERAVLDREADFGVTYAPSPSDELHLQRLARFEFAIFARRSAFRKTAFSALPFAVPVAPPDPPHPDLQGIDCWPYDRIARLVKYRLTSLESALALARGGRCAVFVPEFVARHHNRMLRRESQLVPRERPPGMGPVQRTAFLVSRAEDRAGSSTRRLAAALRRAIQP